LTETIVASIVVRKETAGANDPGRQRPAARALIAGAHPTAREERLNAHQRTVAFFRSRRPRRLKSGSDHPGEAWFGRGNHPRPIGGYMG
jgi:hypothetical protein